MRKIGCNRLKLVTTAEDEGTSVMSHEEEDGRIILHGTMVLKKVVFTWVRTGRSVCADSYFSSVGAAEELLRIGLRFIGWLRPQQRPIQ
jgi:hypothetical protein